MSHEKYKNTCAILCQCHFFFSCFTANVDSDSAAFKGFFYPNTYLGQRYDESAGALLPAGETQVTVGGVERAGRVAARVRRPHRARRHLVELLGAGQAEQGQGVLPYGLLLQDPGGNRRWRLPETFHP